MKNNFLKSSSILIIGEIFTKILGILYLIPLYHINQELGSIMANLFIPYSFMLIFAAIGINSVMTSEVGKYYEKDEVKLRKALTNGLNFTFIMSILSTLFLYIFAPYLMHIITPGNPYEAELVQGVKILSCGVFLFGISNYMRAVLMGFGEFTLISISFFTEQLTKIILILVGIFYLLNVQDTSLGASVYVFSYATVISIFTTLVLFTYKFISKNYYKYFLEMRQYLSKKEFIFISTSGLIFFINGIFITAFDQIDILFFHTAGQNLKISNNEIELIKATYFNWSLKLILIPISLSSAFLSAMIHQYQTSKSSQRNKEIIKIFKTVLVYCLLSTAVFIVLGEYIFTILYSNSNFGINILRIQSLIITFYVMRTLISVYIVLNDRKKNILYNSLTLIVLKIVLNFIFVYYFVDIFKIYSFVMTSIISLFIMTLVMIYQNRDLFILNHQDKKDFVTLILKVFLLIVIMLGINQIINLNFVLEAIVMIILFLVTIFILFMNDIKTIINMRK